MFPPDAFLLLLYLTPHFYRPTDLDPCSIIKSGVIQLRFSAFLTHTVIWLQEARLVCLTSGGKAIRDMDKRPAFALNHPMHNFNRTKRPLMFAGSCQQGAYTALSNKRWRLWKLSLQRWRNLVKSRSFYNHSCSASAHGQMRIGRVLLIQKRAEGYKTASTKELDVSLMVSY